MICCDLEKLITRTFIPGSPGHPGFPGVPARPAYCEIITHEVCVIGYRRALRPKIVQCAAHVGRMVFRCQSFFIHPVYGPPYLAMPGAHCKTERYAVCNRAQVAAPSIPPIPPTPSQIIVNYNVGWNTSSRTEAALVKHAKLTFAVPPGTRGVFVGVAPAGADKQPIGLYKWGVVVDTTRAHVLENGETVHTLVSVRSSGDTFSIERNGFDQIVYTANSNTYTSANIITDLDPLYIYIYLYYGGDKILCPMLMVPSYSVSVTLPAVARCIVAPPSVVYPASFVSGYVASIHLIGAGAVLLHRNILRGEGRLQIASPLVDGSYYAIVNLPASGALSLQPTFLQSVGTLLISPPNVSSTVLVYSAYAQLSGVGTLELPFLQGIGHLETAPPFVDGSYYATVNLPANGRLTLRRIILHNVGNLLVNSPAVFTDHVSFITTYYAHAQLAGVGVLELTYLRGEGHLQTAPPLVDNSYYAAAFLTANGLLFLRRVFLQGTGGLLVSAPAVSAYSFTYFLTATITGYGGIVDSDVYPYQVSLYGISAVALDGVTISADITLPSIIVQSAETEYSYADITLPNIKITAEIEVFTPAPITHGEIILPYVQFSGLLVDLEFCTGDIMLPPVFTLGGDYPYTRGYINLPFLQASGFEGHRLYMSMFDAMIIRAEAQLITDLIIYITSSGQLLSVYATTAVIAREIISTLQAQSTYITSASLQASFLSSARFAPLAQMGKKVGTSTEAHVNALSRVWVVNVDTTAASQYDNYGFNSFFERDGVIYGVADNGIFRLDGDTDNGLPINSQVMPGSVHMGVTQESRLQGVYIAVKGDTMILKVETDGAEPYYYEMRSSSSERMDTHRIDVGRGLKANMWTFTLLNKDGADFELASLEFVPVIRSRRIG